MKRYLMYLCLFFMVIMNIYLMFYWEPISQESTQENVGKEVVTYSKPLYKVNKEKVLEQLSDEEKKELKVIMKKISAFDMGRVKEYYEDPDEDRGIISIIRLLRKRLANSDYKRLEEISSPLIDIKRINDIIKNN